MTPSADRANRMVYKEGIFVGYRGYEHNQTQPLFPFGQGLSYTTFKYSNLVTDEHGVSFDLSNTGSRAGDAVPEVYMAAEQSSVPRPPKELKGLARVTLPPGETRNVKIPLNGTRQGDHAGENGLPIGFHRVLRPGLLVLWRHGAAGFPQPISANEVRTALAEPLPSSRS